MNYKRIMTVVMAGTCIWTIPAAHGQGTGGPAVNAELSCNALRNVSIQPRDIALPTGGAQITAVTLVALTASLPEHCAVSGSIAPVDPTAPPINFRVNLPTEWNSKAMQFGGGGFNGSVVTANGSAPLAPLDAPAPLKRGYATFGSDSGHSGLSLEFALNSESFENFSHAQMKKTLDVAKAVIRLRYGKFPERVYWVGSSQGGREGLMVTQRYGRDYDGVYANVPVGASFTAKAMQGVRIGQALSQIGSWLNTSKVTLLQTAARARCDLLDGLVDGVIANPGACDFDPSSLRCASGADEGDTCLSDAQVTAVRTIHTDQSYGFSLANGINRYPASQWGSENDPSANWQAWITGSSQASLGQIHLGGSSFLRYAVAQNSPLFNPLTFDPAQWQDRLREVSEIHDASNPDLTTFRSNGGKLIVTESGGDYSHSPQATADYVQAVQKRMGESAANEFLRFYIVPGAEHVNRAASGWPAVKIDWVSVLEAWVERGEPPNDKLKLTAQSGTAPFKDVSVRALCRYPTYPHYIGGDVNSFDSFSCNPSKDFVRSLP